MRHISEAYVSVQKAYKHVPFYSTKVMVHDEAEVVKVTQGNFYFSRMCKDGRLNFKLTPTLPAEWFTTEKTDIEWNGNTAEIDENCFACALLGNILLVYHNTQRKNTFGDSGVAKDRKRKMCLSFQPFYF